MHSELKVWSFLCDLDEPERLIVIGEIFIVRSVDATIFFEPLPIYDEHIESRNMNQDCIVNRQPCGGRLYLKVLRQFITGHQ